MNFSRKLKVFVLTGICVLSVNFASAAEVTQKDLNEQSVMAILWVQRSAEYKAICYQTFNLIKENVKTAIAGKDEKSKPLAMVFDIDDTLLDNSPNSAKNVEKDDKFNKKSWNAWVAKSKAEALPGAVEALNWAADHGVEIFYVSNRTMADNYDGTCKNMKRYGFPCVDARHLLLKADQGDKMQRFLQVEHDYNVIMYVGDNVQDFPLNFSGKSALERDALVKENAEDFGRKFIVLPNPVYGSWEGAIVPKYWSLTPQQQNDLRKKALIREN